MRRALLALVLVGCAPPGRVLDPDELTGSIVEASPSEIVVASDLADSATTRVRGVSAGALGARPGDRVRIRRLDPSVGKSDPLDWDCRATGSCDARRE